MKDAISYNSPLLSEFDVLPPLKKLIAFKNLIGLSVAWFMMASIPLLLGSYADANCMRVSIFPVNEQSDKLVIPFGFLAELNHGLFYLLGMPVVIVLGLHCVLQMQLAIRELARGGGPLVFSQEDLVASPALVERLKNGSDELDRFLWSLVPEPTKANISELLESRNVTGVDFLVAKSLTDIIVNHALYDKERFAEVDLAEETELFRLQNSLGTNRTRLNRMLLEDAYPKLILRHETASITLNVPEAVPSASSVLGTIGELNRNVFTVALWFLPMLLCTLLLATELPTINHKCLGWVQAGEFWSYTNVPLKTLQFDEMPEIIAKSTNGWGFPKNKVVNWTNVIFEPLVDLRVERIGSQSPEQIERARRGFPWFLAAALSVEWLSHLFISWAVLKILFFVWILLSANWVDKDASDEQVAPHSKLLSIFGLKSRFRIGLNFKDPKKRYGLILLDPVYNRILVLGILFGGVSWLGRLCNLSKGQDLV